MAEAVRPKPVPFSFLRKKTFLLSNLSLYHRFSSISHQNGVNLRAGEKEGNASVDCKATSVLAREEDTVFIVNRSSCTIDSSCSRATRRNADSKIHSSSNEATLVLTEEKTRFFFLNSSYYSIYRTHTPPGRS